MKINITTGIIALLMTIILTAGGWVITLAISGNDQKHLIREFESQKVEFKNHCIKQADDIAFIKESLVRIETTIGSQPVDRRIGYWHGGGEK